ncbi:MAG: hypothetical protein LBR80_05680 [Deltaproteobacteria bacterium]|jgi:hypothetical protein|nr:hypothetical protein [Deltaproteobacteria bacterium]
MFRKTLFLHRGAEMTRSGIFIQASLFTVHLLMLSAHAQAFPVRSFDSCQEFIPFWRFPPILSRAALFPLPSSSHPQFNARLQPADMRA